MSPIASHKDERGATAVEYGVILVLILVVVITAAMLFSGETSDLYDCTGSSLTSQVPAC